MSQPTPYVPDTSFVATEASDSQFPGSELDVEHGAIKQTTDEIRHNLALIQRDDGALKNESVTLDTLAPDVTARLGGIQGPKGDQGDQGPKGDKGDTGVGTFSAVAPLQVIANALATSDVPTAVPLATNLTFRGNASLDLADTLMFTSKTVNNGTFVGGTVSTQKSTPTGTGAQLRTLQAIFADRRSSTDYDTLAHAITAQDGAGGGAVHVPDGTAGSQARLTSTTTVARISGSKNPINVFGDGETTWFGREVIRGTMAGAHPDEAHTLAHTEMTATGSSKDGPTSADYGHTVSAIKHGYATGTALAGEMDAINVVVRQDGPDTGEPSDCSGMLMNIQMATPNAFASGVEGNISYILRGPTFAIQKRIGWQLGAMDNKTGTAHLLVLSSVDGTIDSGLNIQQSGTSTITSPIVVTDNNGQVVFKVGSTGKVSVYDPTTPDDTTRYDITNDSGGIVLKRPDGAVFFSVTPLANATIYNGLTVSGDGDIASMQLRPRTAPAAVQGRMYFDSGDSKLKVCEDGVNWKTVTTS